MNLRPSGYEPDELPTAPPRDIKGKNGAEDRNRTGTRGKSRRILSPVRLPVPPLRHTTWLRATLPGGCPPSTIAAKELNFCVRYGNRCILFAIITRLVYFVFEQVLYYHLLKYLSTTF